MAVDPTTGLTAQGYTAQEASFVINTPTAARSISAMGQTIDINQVNTYSYMDEAYYGNGGFRDGRYLVPFSRESNYQQRRQLGHYKNYLKPIIRAMVEPVFSEMAIRSVKDENDNDVETLFEDFIEDCDAACTHLQDYTHQAVNVCRRHGVSFTVMDNYTTQPDNLQAAKENRIYPYVYMKKANEVEEYKIDNFGNITSITFTDTPVKVNDKIQKRYRMWTETECILMTKNDAGKWVEIYKTYHGLGRVPVIAVYSEIRETRNVILPDPPLYDLGRLNHVIYNQASEIRDLERSQSFSVFYVQGIAPGDLSIGANNYINIPLEASITPGYAAPDPAIMAGLVSNQDQIRKDLFLIAEQAGVVGVQNSESGIAKSYDFFAHEETLKATSRIATTLELAIADLFMLYTKENFVYTVIYPMDFQPMGLDREVDRIDKVLKMPGLNPLLVSKVQEKLARMLMADQSPEIVQEIIDSIQLNTEDKSTGKPEAEEPEVEKEEPVDNSEREDITDSVDSD